MSLVEPFLCGHGVYCYLLVHCYIVRYRKVAADKCVGGPLVDKYRAVQVNCPVVKPAGLSIEVDGGDVIRVNKNVTFNLTQEQVTHFCFIFYFQIYCARS